MLGTAFKYDLSTLRREPEERERKKKGFKSQCDECYPVYVLYAAVPMVWSAAVLCSWCVLPVLSLPCGAMLADPGTRLLLCDGAWCYPYPARPWCMVSESKGAYVVPYVLVSHTLQCSSSRGYLGFTCIYYIY